MPPPTLPYKRPFYKLTLDPQEIEEDLAAIISNTKRRRRSSPPASGNPPIINGRDRDRMMGDRDAG
jgi:hypothetical protein